MTAAEQRFWNSIDKRLSTLEGAVDFILNNCCAGSGVFPLQITDFSGSSSSAEIGSTVNGLVLNWIYNGIADPSLQTISGIGPVANNLRTYNYTSPLTVTTVFSLHAERDALPRDKDFTFSFLNRRYWGASASPNLGFSGSNPINYVDLISAGLTSDVSETKIQSRTINCTGGKYIYFLWPQRLGTSDFRLNGLPFNSWNIGTWSVTNAQGFTELYYVYRSVYIQTGSAIPVEVIT